MAFMEKLISHYNVLLKQYNDLIVNAFDDKDFFEYTENLFTAHSCGIEGNSFSVNDTRELNEKGLNAILHNKSLLEAFEILDHFKAYEFAFSNISQPLTESFIKELHSVLTFNTLKFTKNSEPGEYTTTDMAAGDTLFGDHKQNIALIPKLLEQTQLTMDKGELHPMLISAKFHYHFIYLHPFRDGNGRLGRLLSNFILAKKQHPLVIIRSEEKEKYIEALKASKRHRDTAPIETFFFETAIYRMTHEIAQKKNLTQNFFLKLKPTQENEEKKTKSEINKRQEIKNNGRIK
ncbi:restriction endonuclease subunit S [Elizabethkingia anophelis]|nr:restriction endonuclease subunit S [Elizabethkingia anophelis]MDV3544589.1 restriction endonuclease subunit S [Elizabethkingia anophelis]PKR31532.1 Fic family protein [Elizabethkingia anophelis]PKR34767.1 Fic family protein [Elizabethkingia anophelis]PRQ80912.1 restriction endonuclease subunit S [Elizabethkingia anophelis]